MSNDCIRDLWLIPLDHRYLREKGNNSDCFFSVWVYNDYKRGLAIANCSKEQDAKPRVCNLKFNITEY